MMEDARVEKARAQRGINERMVEDYSLYPPAPTMLLNLKFMTLIETKSARS